MFPWEPEGHYRYTTDKVNGYSALLVLNGTSFNSDSTLLVLNGTSMSSGSALLAVNSRYDHVCFYASFLKGAQGIIFWGCPERTMDVPSVHSQISLSRACSFTSENVWGTRNFPPNYKFGGIFSCRGGELCGWLARGRLSRVAEAARRRALGGLWAGSGLAPQGRPAWSTR